MSWPVGRGRRQWISVGPVGLLLLAPFWLAGWLLWLIVVAVYGAWMGLGWLLVQARETASR